MHRHLTPTQFARCAAFAQALVADLDAPLACRVTGKHLQPANDSRPRAFFVDGDEALTKEQLLRRHPGDADLRTWAKTAAIGQSYGLVNALGGTEIIECIHDEDADYFRCKACEGRGWVTAGTGVNSYEDDCAACAGKGAHDAAGAAIESYERRRSDVAGGAL